MKQQEDLYPGKRDNKQHYLHSASYALSNGEKETMFDWLNSIKVPFGYLSNIQRKINMKDMKN